MYYAYIMCLLLVLNYTRTHKKGSQLHIGSGSNYEIIGFKILEIPAQAHQMH